MDIWDKKKRSDVMAKRAELKQALAISSRIMR